MPSAVPRATMHEIGSHATVCVCTSSTLAERTIRYTSTVLSSCARSTRPWLRRTYPSPSSSCTVVQVRVSTSTGRTSAGSVAPSSTTAAEAASLSSARPVCASIVSVLSYSLYGRTWVDERAAPQAHARSVRTWRSTVVSGAAEGGQLTSVSRTLVAVPFVQACSYTHPPPRHRRGQQVGPPRAAYLACCHQVLRAEHAAQMEHDVSAESDSGARRCRPRWLGLYPISSERMRARLDLLGCRGVDMVHGRL